MINMFSNILRTFCFLMPPEYTYTYIFFAYDRFLVLKR